VTPRRGRRINWFVTGGHLIEVDESGEQYTFVAVQAVSVYVVAG